ncbi:MAG: hypothetical protein ACPHRO_02020 [Nannocystaceae bacterium]
MKTAKLLILAAATFCTTTSLGCDKSGSSNSPRRKSARLNWVMQPETGTQVDNMIKVPGAGITFEIPDTLYVFKQCEEASHEASGPDSKWVPIVACSRVNGEDGDAPIALTFYATSKDMLINERSVATIKNNLNAEGVKVEEAGYYDDYLSKPGRRGILVEYHSLDDEGFPKDAIRQFMFPKGDVLFVVQTKFPYTSDRSGINRDWQRILWNFQLDEDGPLYEGQ